MKLKIEWEKIKDGFAGFEKLACKYVESNFPNPTWQPTPPTRDGNKDAVAVFFGYKDNQFNAEQWWMEAKYSSSVDKLSRYRLDATIVSAILEKKVSKVIFVTNTIINAKTINDIRNALYSSIHCNDVSFCTKYSLEYWLIKNINIYKDYFDVPSNIKESDIEQPDQFVISEIEYYSEISNIFSFKEPLRELHIGEKYFGYFEIFSCFAQKVSLKPHCEMKGITIIDNDDIQLNCGETFVKFAFYIEEYNFVMQGNTYSPIFILNDIEIPSSKYIVPIRKENFTFNLVSQKNLIQELGNQYRQFEKTEKYYFNFIEGISGSGKSHILESFLKEFISPTQEIFFAEFTDSPKNNNEILIYLLLFVLFPFINPADIDNEYLKKIENNCVGNSVLDLVSKKDDFDNLAKTMSNYQIDDCIFPRKININKRIIVLDDLQKLTKYEANFLSVIIADLQRHNLPIFALLSSQPSYYLRQSYKTIKEYCIIKHYNYSLGLNDIFRSLPDSRKNNFYLNQELSYSMEFNVIEIFLFAKYILDNQIFLNNIHDFIEICKIFQRTSILESYIIKQFNDFFHVNPQCRNICDSIYWASEPRKINLYANNNEITLLLANGFIKYNYDSCLMPINDIYKLYYCNHFKTVAFNENEYKENSIELTKYRLNHEADNNLLLQEVSKIFELANNQKFYSISFILQDIFETSKKENLKNRLDKITYYKLYFIYALSATQQSVDRTGYDIFLELGDEIRDVTIPEIIELSISTDWDLAIGDYERLRYTQAFERMKLIIKSILKLIRIKKDSKGLMHYSKYYDVLMLDTLIKANKDEISARKLYLYRISLMENYGLTYRSKSFQVRFALTLCTKGISECLNILERCSLYFQQEYGSEDKYYLWANYHFNYFFMIYNKKPELIDKVIKFHNSLKKNFYLNYRQRINGLASYFYYIGEIANGNKYLLLESSFFNELPTRQVAFHYATVALHEVLVGNAKEAKKALQQVISMFDGLPNYQHIAIHNLNILEKSPNISEIEYWFGGNMDPDIYYIDSRCSW